MKRSEKRVILLIDLTIALVLSSAAALSAQAQRTKQDSQRSDTILQGFEVRKLADAATLKGKCNTKDNVVAVTNGVETTIKSPRNTGDCEFTLRCRDKDKKTTGKPFTIPKDGMLQSFSCGKDAVDIAMDCGGEKGECNLTYTDR